MARDERRAGGHVERPRGRGARPGRGGAAQAQSQSDEQRLGSNRHRIPRVRSRTAASARYRIVPHSRCGVRSACFSTLVLAVESSLATMHSQCGVADEPCRVSRHAHRDGGRFVVRDEQRVRLSPSRGRIAGKRRQRPDAPARRPRDLVGGDPRCWPIDPVQGVPRPRLEPPPAPRRWSSTGHWESHRGESRGALALAAAKHQPTASFHGHMRIRNASLPRPPRDQPPGDHWAVPEASPDGAGPTRSMA